MAVGGIALVMVIIVCALSSSWSGDSFSDMNTLMAGENFAAHGLFRLRFLPVHHIGPMTDPPSYYTHYPPLPDVMNGLMRIVGIRSLAAMRILCGLLCVAGLVCMYLAFAPDIGPLPAACGLGFVATTGYFFTYCTSVHQHAYNIFFVGVFLLLFAHAVRSRRTAIMAWAGCWVVLMLESLSSFEFIIYPQVFALIYVLATGQIHRRWRSLVLLATAPLAGVGLHLLQNCLALGWSSAVADAVGAFGQAGGETAQARWDFLKEVPGRIGSYTQRFFYWPWPVLAVLAAVLPTVVGRQRQDSVTARRTSALLLAVLAAPVAWYLFMPGHTVGHKHTASQLLPAAFVIMGGVIAAIVRWLAKRRLPVHKRVLAGLAGLVVVFGQTQTIAERLHGLRLIGGPWLCLFEAMGDTALPPKAAVLTNSRMRAQLGYCLRRPNWTSPTPTLPFKPESVASLQKRLPDDWRIRYYIFNTEEDPAAFPFLAGNYPGKLATLPGLPPGRGLIIFDISTMLDPGGKRPGLDPAVRKTQLEGNFPPWDQPGFKDRLENGLRWRGKL